MSDLYGPSRDDRAGAQLSIIMQNRCMHSVAVCKCGISCQCFLLVCVCFVYVTHFLLSLEQVYYIF
jgi:hypothetical protein